VANSANWQSKKIWETCGGVAAALYSFDWFRPIRPARALLELAGRHRGRPMRRALCILADAADLIGAKLVKWHTRNERAGYMEFELDKQYAVDPLARAPGFDLRPRYDVASFSWLLEMGRNSAAGGWLRTAMVRDERQQPEVGWYVYFQPRERFGRVLQLVATPGHLDTVLRPLSRTRPAMAWRCFAVTWIPRICKLTTIPTVFCIQVDGC